MVILQISVCSKIDPILQCIPKLNTGTQYFWFKSHLIEKELIF